MLCQNTAKADRSFTLLRGRTTGGRAVSTVVTVKPGEQADFSADDLRLIANNRAMSAIFERDFIPGRSDVITAGVAKPARGVITDKMAKLIAMAEGGHANQDQAAARVEVDQGVVSANLRDENDRTTIRQPKGVHYGQGLVIPEGLHLSAKDAAELAAKMEGRALQAPEVSASAVDAMTDDALAAELERRARARARGRGEEGLDRGADLERRTRENLAHLQDAQPGLPKAPDATPAPATAPQGDAPRDTQVAEPKDTAVDAKAAVEAIRTGGAGPKPQGGGRRG